MSCVVRVPILGDVNISKNLMELLKTVFRGVFVAIAVISYSGLIGGAG